ncbi:Type 4 prepilin-like proteins leader peptide-processing enzyme [invertebrate metagenome]|uniref:Type 4 prepilin-like proteins leader peptide-processing enzyme n=1 Tax=invertebrate metagenome TaxID=1711999 RepID=A0A2H9TC26_9ZZZZ
MTVLLGNLDIHASVFLVGLAAIGLATGSFLNVVIYRLPLMLQDLWQRECVHYLKEQKTDHVQLDEGDKLSLNLAIPSSHCPACGHKIRCWENIPVISFVWLKGRCSSCHGRISWQYPVVEILCACLTIAIGWRYGMSAQTLVLLPLVWVLVALSFIDLHKQLLPDNLTLPLLWGGLLVNSFSLMTTLHDAVWGAVAGYLSLWAVYWLFKKATGKEGMGYGDFKLLAALGAWLGWIYLPMIILLSSLTGSLVTLLLIVLKKHQRSKPVPFGPYLAMAGLMILFYGEPLLKAYQFMVGL